MIKAFKEESAKLAELKRVEASRIDAFNKATAQVFKLRAELEREVARSKEEKARQEKEHQKAFADFLAITKQDVIEVVLKTKLKMAEEAAAKGYDVSMWKVDEWRARVQNFSNETPTDDATNMDHVAEVAKEAAKEVERTLTDYEGLDE